MPDEEWSWVGRFASRRAGAERRSDWRELERNPSVAELEGTWPARLAEAWLEIALVRHARVAAFARFTTELAVLGAPPELVERAAAGVADHVRHAKHCFALASAYFGAPLGPGHGQFAPGHDGRSLGDAVLGTLRDGCLGGTVAALEARQASDHCSDPVVRDVLTQIGADEAHHAELCWRFVRWALAQGSEELAARVEEELHALTSETEAPAASLNEVERTLLSHGILPQSLRDAIRAQAIRDVVLPCSERLALGTRGAGVGPGALSAA